MNQASARAPATHPPSAALRRAKRIGWLCLPPSTFIALIVLWAVAIPVFKIPPYLVPSPAGVFARIVTDWRDIWSNSLITIAEILLGFGVTVVTAIPLGLAIALSRVARQVCIRRSCSCSWCQRSRSRRSFSCGLDSAWSPRCS